ncbi:omega-6 fatty acid desaturase (delta-12 desaturase) [Cryptococcus gattii Ru294]|uniref:Delta-12 fatty acid desaturase, putative n=2 Tax=Cryptococcus gattii TaxID=37769 RepID=E6R445_CRYGW|nr:Delta-12 fatty acid desaturase, putative [Cryptococcus gattii WM276]KIR57222.1 omega-6 fatty acid desaturase (delta-12 desaturase) [Cryptococcus gattii Ru294]KIR80768.1 omega-6 fatty acid desaturase (delta-12 desaturase) [Cryptococcus gattii EJB2]KIY35626.1 omega-6 fatty acid desaturase (delta-12 desaturase) [Cryptococcus gattii E566]KJE03295.1 omega-6 fatty acid desaturase (delta-12 desaturase) [Cryptococcus gattii NT-10]ADV21904.1 Delta-12 fatty acid desaturase, putative [Cryptococcus gat
MTSTLRQRAVTPPAGQAEKDQLLREAEEKEISQGQQFVVPNFTIKQLLDAIPAHCYKRSALRSSLYVVQDAVIIAALVYGAFHIDSFLGRFSLSPVAYYAAKFALWSAYWVATGLFGTGIWVIAHEAGHQAYSSSKTINNAVGWVLHSALLVPYHSWRISHGRHHAATGHLTRDEVFVPRTRKQLGYPEVEEEGEILGMNVSKERQSQLREALEDSPIVVCYNLFLQQLFGWPMYLIRNASGQLHYPNMTNHFSPRSFIFKASQYWQIVWSDIGVVLVFAALAFWASQRGIKEVATIYGIPYLWVNHWLVFITFLQHTDPVLPHYSANKWTFPRGALATIDRDFLGPVGAYVFHGITETHVAHHISSKIPHYNAWEATEALKKFLGPAYHKSDENMFVSCYKSYRDCLFVEDGQDIVFYKNASGLAQRVPVEESGNISDSGIDMAESK